MNSQQEILQAPILSRRLAALREIDVAAHGAFIEASPLLSDHLEQEAELAALADLVAQVATEAPEAARAFVNRLGSQPSMAADTAGLRRWALHGLHQRRHDEKGRVHYFEWGDPLVFSDKRTRSDTGYVLDQRDALLHYLAGYGFGHFAIDLHEPPAAGAPFPATTIGDAVILLPRRVDGVKPENCEFLFRATFAHLAAHLRHSPLKRLAGNRRPTLLALTALIEDARVERLMIQDHPGLHALWDRFHTASQRASGFDLAGLAARLTRALHEPAYADANAWVRKGRELFEEIAAGGLHDVAAFDHLARLLSIDLGKMRLELPRHYRPTPIYRDDNAVLWNKNTALPTDESAHSDAEFEFASRDEKPQRPDLAELALHRRFHYPEWDHRLEALREDWATVLEPVRSRRRTYKLTRFARSGPAPVLGLKRTPDRSIRLSRMLEGDELDLNSMIENAVQQRAGLELDGRIFCRHGRCRRSTAIVLLVDLSVSTDRFVQGSFTRVIELEKQTAMVIAEGLDPQRDRIAVHGFASNGRHEVNYERVKDFDEPFDAPQRARLAALTSRLSTRMGAALRHASAALAEETADHKVILVLTDGEPSDIDVVEDDYLVEDAREAVLSASAQHIRTFCLTLDRRADHYARRIFGARNYLITEQISTFTNSTNNTLARLLAS